MPNSLSLVHLDLTDLDPWLAALLVGLAAALWVTSPARVVSRADGVAAEDVGRAGPATALAWLQGRPDAPSLSRRAALALVAAVAVGVGMQAGGDRLAVVGWALAPVVMTVCVVVLGRLEPSRTRRRREQLRADLPHALELMSACLAAGMPLRAAASAVAGCFEGPVADDLHQVLALVNLGTSDIEAWASLGSSPEWRPTVVDLVRSVESGTMMVEVLVHHARDARRARSAAIEVRAKAVGVRSVLPLMVCFLPAFLLVGVIPTVASALLNALP